ncbi:hypothetical protein ACEPAH_6792 [Sanghuangporus vaninii]
MSDNARWGVTDRAEAKLKPDSEKSTTEHLGDKVKGKTDSAAGSAQPESEKSYTQQATDKVSSSGTDNRSYTDKTKDALGLGK